MIFLCPKNDINLPDARYNPIISIKTKSNTIFLWSMSAMTKAALHNTILINSILLSSY